MSSEPLPRTLQFLVNDVRRCEQEIRQCQLSYLFDKNFTEIIDSWHHACDEELHSPVTTPALTSPTFTVDVAACPTIIASCGLWSSKVAGCPTTVGAGNSCRCESSVVSLASVCFVDGNETCFGKPGDVSNLWEFQSCAGATNAQAVSRS